ncbi:MAG TPA: DMT family transporter, partial [Nannocystaceae bacterium]|nr:DMT family transporter [Nannocystaceae bacterium]
GIAALAVLALAPVARRRPTWRALVVGIAYAATVVLFVLANKLTTAANTIFLQSTAPMYVLLVSPWLLGESIRRRDLGFVALAAAGLSLFFLGTEPPRATAPDPTAGNLIAVGSGVAWAATLVGFRWLGHHREPGGDPVHTVVVGNLLAFAVCLPAALPVGAVGIADASALVYLGVCQIALPYLLLTRAVRHVSALEASMLLLVEPALNPVWAFVLHGEMPGALAIAGGVVVLGASLAKAWVDGHSDEPSG